MTNMFSNYLVQRVWVCIGVANKAPVVVVMVPSEPHLRIQGELVTVFLQRLHVVAECVIRASLLRKDIREKAVTHTNAEQPFDVGLARRGKILPKALQSRQEQCAAGGF